MATVYGMTSDRQRGELDYKRCRDVLFRHFNPPDAGENSRWGVRLSMFLRRIRADVSYSVLDSDRRITVWWLESGPPAGPEVWEQALILNSTELAAFDVWLVFKAEEFF